MNKPFNAYKVLVVDDDTSHRKMATHVLELADFLVRQAENGQQALERVALEDFDVVLMDKRMPLMDGDEACRKIRQELGKTLLPIIMVTGSRAEEQLVNSLGMGANDFVCKPYSPSELIARVTSAANTKRITDQLDSAETVLFSLARMVEAKDGATGDHCARLQHMANAFGQRLGLDHEDMLALQRGGVLHDIGKLGIPDSILLKAGRLDEDEWKVMKTHTVIGANLCQGLNSMKTTLPIILCHHERWDGSGYPYGLKGEEIPYLARVFQLLDIYDALSNERSYKQALSNRQVLEVLKEEVDNGWRDPELAHTFIDLLVTEPEVLLVPEAMRGAQQENAFGDLQGTLFRQIVS